MLKRVKCCKLYFFLFQSVMSLLNFMRKKCQVRTEASKVIWKINIKIDLRTLFVVPSEISNLHMP